MAEKEKDMGRVSNVIDESCNIEELVALRNELIKQYPPLKKIQQDVDDLLCETVNPATRMEILFFLLSEKITEMMSAISNTEKIINTLFSDP